MSEGILIIGESGTGKSTSLRNLDPSETFIVNVVDKPLPFRGYKKLYTPVNDTRMEGNYYSTDDPMKLSSILKFINTKRTDIKVLVIDDFGYMITNSFMRKAALKGYDKFVDLGKEVYDALSITHSLRDDLFCIFTMHTEIDKHGSYKPKTVGNMIDQYICIEGKFTYVLHSVVREGKYQFLTNNHGPYVAKSPMGAFETLVVDNDLCAVINKIKEYNEGV